MKQNNNIDELFKSRLNDMEVQPPDNVWEKIESSIAKPENSRKAVFHRWLSAAAVFIGLLVAGWFVFDKNPQAPQKQYTQETKSNSNDKLNIDSVIKQKKEIVIAENHKSDTNENYVNQKRTVIADNNSTKNQFTEKVNETLSRLDQSYKKIASIRLTNITEQNHDKQRLKEINETAREADFLSEYEKEIIAENIRNNQFNKKEQKHWSIGIEVAPNYNSNISKHGNEYAKTMKSSNENASNNMSFGVSVKYGKSKRWKIKTGIYYAQNGNASAATEVNQPMMEKDDIANSPGNEMFYRTANVKNDFVSGEQLANSSAGIIKFDKSNSIGRSEIMTSSAELSYANEIYSNEFSQVFDFVEVPLFLQWRVIDKKIDVDMIGGVQASVVVGNSVYSKSHNGYKHIGTTKDISKVNLSGSIGIGVGYPLSKKLYLSLEPRINYYLQSISTNSKVDYRPYSIGLYTGLSYSF